MGQAQTPPGAGAAVEAPWEELRAIVGAEHARAAAPEDGIADTSPRMVIEPGSEEELAAALRCADLAGLVVAPRGGGTKMAWGNPPVRADVILSTARLNHVLEHTWADLTVSVEAGCTFQHLQDELAQHGQRIALDPLWPERATIGGILSTNDSGTLRLRFGALRDLIIGATLALADGTLAKSGGKVVKNVAGYDLSKLATGALGTLGIITRAIFRLYPLPLNVRSLTFLPGGFEEANRLILAILDSKLVPTGLQARLAGGSPPAVDVRFEGTEAGLTAQSETVRKIAATAKETDSSLQVWQARQGLCSSAETSAIAKFSVLPAAIAKTCERVEHISKPLNIAWSAVVQATGIGWLRLDAVPPTGTRAPHSALRALREEIQRDGGWLAVMHRPTGMESLDAWGTLGDSFPLMLSVKQQFDPKGTLNPGRFIGGI
jgi:glycolate oxidase FAD binding subunit